MRKDYRSPKLYQEWGSWLIYSFCKGKENVGHINYLSVMLLS